MGRLAQLVVLLVVAAPAGVRAEGGTGGDWLALARMVASEGDRAIITRVEAGPLEGQVPALRATRFLREPELAIGPLARVARTDDPFLAAEAIHALLALVDVMGRAELHAREADADGFVEARRELAGLAADHTARADHRAAARWVLARLDELAPLPR